jgi:hypothetical protein
MPSFGKASSKEQRGEQLLALRRLQIPNFVADGTTVSGSMSKSVLRCIDDHGPSCWASVETIASETMLSERTVRRACKALEHMGLVIADHRLGRTSVYEINWKQIQKTPDVTTGVEMNSTLDVPTTTPDATTGHPGRCVRNPGRCVRRNERNENETKKKRKRGRSRVIPTLEEVVSFWKAESLKGDPDSFFLYYETNGWMQGKDKPIKNWQMAARGWSCREPSYAKTSSSRLRPIANVGTGVNFDPNRDMSNAEF